MFPVALWVDEGLGIDVRRLSRPLLLPKPRPPLCDLVYPMYCDSSLVLIKLHSFLGGGATGGSYREALERVVRKASALSHFCSQSCLGRPSPPMAVANSAPIVRILALGM